MKTIKLVSSAVFMLMISTFTFAQTQDKPNRDAEGKIVRGPYLTNSFGDNWFIGVGGGINLFGNKKNGFKANITPALDINAGKWLTPGFGIRFGYQGLTGSENSSANSSDPNAKTKEKFGFAYVHGDAMWNMINSIWGYRQRVYNISPYVHGGLLCLYDVRDAATEGTMFGRGSNDFDREFAAGFGLLNEFRIAKRVNLTLDVRQFVFSPRFHTLDSGKPASNMSATLGLQFLIGKTGWERGVDKAALAEGAAALAAAEAALAAAKDAQKAAEDKNAKLQEEKDALANSIGSLNDKIDSLAKAAQDAEKVYINDTTYVTLKLGTAPCTVFFDKGSYKMNDTETQHLRFYIENILKQDPEHVFELTGSTDSATGSAAYNAILGEKRAKAVKNFMMKNYKVKDEQLKIKSIESTSKFMDPRFNRSVIIEH